MKPWIVVPVFDEAPTIAEVVGGAREHGPVLVVDDGSSDDGAARARAAGAEVIRHPRRLGKGQALRTGFAAARQRGASHVVTLDGDGQHAPADLPTLLSAAARTPDAIVIGGRLAESPSVLLADRVNAIRLASFFVDWVTGVRLADTQSGFRVYPLSLFDRIRSRHGGFVFETEILVLAAGAGVPILELAVTPIPRAARRSRFRPVLDGTAIGRYLAARTLERWAAEVRAAGGEVIALFERERLRARHAEMLEAGAACGDSLAAWGTALTGVGLRRVNARLHTWWNHPRRRRAASAAWGTLLAPGLLAVLFAQSLGLFPDRLTTLVASLYDQDRLHSEPAATATLVETETAIAPSP